MENEITLFSESEMESIHELSCYQGLPFDSIDRLESRANNIHQISNKASFDIAIELCEARNEYRHNKHGGFEGWIEEKLKFGRATAYNIIWRYEQFGTVQNFGQLDIALSAQYQLAAPSTPREARDEAIELAESGEKITVSKANELIEKWQKIAEEAQKKAANTQKQLDLLTQLFQEKDEILEKLSQKIAELEQELERVATVEVVPQAIKDEISTLRELNKKQKERNNMLSDHIEKLRVELQNQRDANEARRKQEEYEIGIKQEWKKATDALFSALSAFMGKIPSPIATQVFEGEEWARYDKIDQALTQFQGAFRAISTTRYGDKFIDAVDTDSLIVYGG